MPSTGPHPRNPRHRRTTGSAFARPAAGSAAFTTLALVAVLLTFAIPTRAQVILTEFGAVNASTLLDEDGAAEDWIELANPGPEPVPLAGWSLTDNAADRRKWTFPATNLAPRAHLLVFASGKDRRTPGSPLHANFRLSSDGEYLALIAPDDRTATEFAPAFPRQFRDVSYGFAFDRTTLTLVAPDAPGRLRIPSDDTLGLAWTAPDFNDSAWQPIVNGVGFDTGAPDPDASSYALRVLATEPALYWRLDESDGNTAANLGSWGDAGRGRFEGAPQLGQPGPRPPRHPSLEPDNRAPLLDGDDDFIGGPMGLLSDRTGFTMAGWIRPTRAQSSRTGLWGQNDAVEFGFISPSTLQLWTPSGSVELTYPHPNGEWHHLTAVGTADALQIYLDGTLAAQSPGGGGHHGSSPFPFNAGGGGVFDASGNAFAGQLDEIAVWTRTLSPTEISGLFEAAPPVSYAPLIATDLRDLLHGIHTTAYVRFPFTLEDPTSVSRLTLRVRYDDGLVAWLNGVPVASLNAPDAPDWTAAATRPNPDHRAIQWQELDLTPHAHALVHGPNVLAVQGLNLTADDPDFLIQVELSADRPGLMAETPRYFTVPTPGAPNNVGAADLGPIVVDALHTPNEPSSEEPLTLQVHVAPTFAPVAAVQLRYRIQFGPEQILPMEPAAGLHSATLPAPVAAPGQMIRYHITATDTEGRTSRWPLHTDPLDSEAWLGTVVRDASIQSALPVLHLFVENPGAADTFSGTRIALFHAGELYDNVRMRLRGQSSSGFPKKGYNLDFPADHRFLYRPGATRVKDIRLLTNWGDKARVRNALAYEFLAASGSLAHFAFQVRLQRNGQFFSIADLVEDSDDRWLERLGRDPRGALYKMYNNLGSAGGNEKKTRRWENFNDLQSLVTALDEGRSLTQRALHAWDHLDLPQIVSYFAGLALCSSQDHGHKNYYLYRDSDGSGEWALLPWDVDLTWGRNWLDARGYFTDTLFQDNVLTFYNPAQQNKPANRLYNLVFDHPEFRAMVLRRLRTVMDTVLQPPGTPAAELRIEARVRAMMDAMDPPGIAPSDADLDFQRWGSWGNGNPMRAEAERLLSIHLPGRRTFLFDQNPLLRGDPIPPSQPAAAAPRFGRLDFLPNSGNPLEEFVELTNPHPHALDLSGWRIRGAIDHTFRPGTVVPAGRSLHLSPDARSFRARTASPRGHEGHFVQGNYRGFLSARGDTLLLEDDTGRLMASHSYEGRPTQAQQFLRITEIFYNPDPVPGLPHDAQSYEFLELRNLGPEPLDLTGIRLTRGVRFDFSLGTIPTLAPAAHVLVVRDVAAFTARYGPLDSIAGTFEGALDNAGETLRLDDAVGEMILEFAYDDAWYPITDGRGHSLVFRDPSVPWDTWGHSANWRPSTRPGGSPGTVDDPFPPAERPRLVVEPGPGGALELRFQTAPGQAYTVQAAATVTQAIWLDLDHLPAGPARTVSIPLPLVPDPARYFRLRLD
ncbi:MAG: lamin tail domain-containing protein [Verrucomicrobiae bacterium]|nr:lamin tail domain-containing protein [Verrucomicrobiae bacterium]